MNTPTVHETIEKAQAGWERIPKELRDRDQWCLAGPDKSPMMINGGHAKVTDPSTWTTFDAVCAAAAKTRQFIGYVLWEKDPFACIDFDVKDAESRDKSGKPIDPSRWTTPEQMQKFWAGAVQLDSYTELSRSGKGLHIWVRGKIGKGIRDDKHHVEVYSQERFIISTGNVVIDAPIQDHQDWLNLIVERSGNSDAIPYEQLKDEPPTQEDDELLKDARDASNAEKFNTLWLGNWQSITDPKYPSQSEGDLALVAMLGFWSKNNEQVKRLFRLSGLGKREKAIKNDKYLNFTLMKVRSRQAYELVRRFNIRKDAEGPIGVEDLKRPVMDKQLMMNSLIAISSDKLYVAFFDTPTLSLPMPVMADLLAPNMTTIVVDEETKEEAEVPTFKLWVGDPDRKNVFGVGFDPRTNERIMRNEDDGLRYLNLWQPIPHIAPEDWQHRSQPFVDHLRYLIPITGECDWFLDWCAHMVQIPGELPHHHWLFVTPTQGIGRNWLADVVGLMLKGYVALSFNLVDSLKRGFNGRLSRKLVAVVDEINEGGGSGERWRHSETLKEMLTQTIRNINPKYGAERVERNCCRMLMFSNYETALPLQTSDRRINVVRNPDTPQSETYYKALYFLIDRKNPERDVFVASVRELLLRRDLSKYNPGAHAANNDAKKVVVAASLTDEDRLAMELKEQHPREVIFAHDLYAHVFGSPPDYDNAVATRVTSTNYKVLAHIAQKVGLIRLEKKLWSSREKKWMSVWVLRNAQCWRKANVDEIATELNK